MIHADTVNGQLKPYSLENISVKKNSGKKGEQEGFSEWMGFKRSTGSKKSIEQYSKDFKKEARKEADRCIQEAKKRASEIEREAYEKAFAQGEQAGIEMGRKKVEPVIHSFHEILEDLSSLRERIYEKSEHELIKLALVISRSIIHQEITLNREIVLNTVKAALQNAIEVGGIKIRVNPFDMEFIRQCRPQLLSSTEGIKSITIEEDKSILNGGCVVETDFGDVDARIENQIEELDRVLRYNVKDQGSQDVSGNRS
ncbi:MAG: FliH/SctL family protein [Thermodesulfobacteriota bacterium]|nr:FliH/SctL family protein [Thermodesulfobacteriota bacterium]